MPPNPKEIPDKEPVSLYLKDGELSPAGHWANYLKNLVNKVVFRREVPPILDPEDPYSLKWVPKNELSQFLFGNGQQTQGLDLETFWKTRLENLDAEIGRVGADNSKLGMSLLILKGFISDQMATQDIEKSTPDLETTSNQDIENMVGNGLRVVLKTSKKVRLTPTTPKNEQLLINRGVALNRLGSCFADMDMVKVPKPIAVSPTQRYIDVECAPGQPLSSIDSREEQLVIDEIPRHVRHKIVVQLLRGIDNYNMQGYVFGDYNASSYNFDPKEEKLWITDPGLSEIVNGDYSQQLPIAKASAEEVYKMFEFTGLTGLMETFGIDTEKIFRLKELSSRDQLKEVSDIIDVIQS